MQQQVEDQDGAEDIEHDATEAPAVDRESLAKQQACSTKEQDRKQIIGEGGEKRVEIHDVAPDCIGDNSPGYPYPQGRAALFLIGVDRHQIEAIELVGELQVVECVFKKLHLLLVFSQIEQVLEV